MDLQGDHGTPSTPKSWAKGIIVGMIEITHSQWLYRNVHVHDTVTELHATRRKEELQKEIQYQIQIGGEELTEDDKYLLGVNLEDMDTTSGERQEYWILAIQAAREARILGDSERNASANGKAA